MIERKRKPPYRLLILAFAVSSFLSYAMYRSFVEHSIATPATSAAERTVNELDPNAEDPSLRRPDLPVWPPPSGATPVDPASNPMQGALPMRIDWPDAAQALPAHSAR